MTLRILVAMIMTAVLSPCIYGQNKNADGGTVTLKSGESAKITWKLIQGPHEE